MSTNTLARSLRDVGLAAWFGGTLERNRPQRGRGRGRLRQPHQSRREGWMGPLDTRERRRHCGTHRRRHRDARHRPRPDRLAERCTPHRRGEDRSHRRSAWCHRLQPCAWQEGFEHTAFPAESGAHPSTGTPKDVADAQRQLRLLQWAVPALTGAIILVSAQAGEEQRPGNLFRGLAARLPGLPR